MWVSRSISLVIALAAGLGVPARAWAQPDPPAPPSEDRPPAAPEADGPKSNDPPAQPAPDVPRSTAPATVPETWSSQPDPGPGGQGATIAPGAGASAGASASAGAGGGANGEGATGGAGVDRIREEAAPPTREQLTSGRSRPEVREESGNPFRQSVLIFDQSLTTQTVDVGATPLSYVPLYEIWLSFRPRYSFDEHWSLRGRFDYTKELTNQQSTTYRNEDIFGDVWTDLVYSTKLDALWRGTRVSGGLRALWPTSKASQGAGTFVKLGARGAADHQFELRGPDAPSFSDFHVGVSFSYLHPFTSATTANSYCGFGYTRQDVDEHSFVSDQLTGQTLAEHVLWVALDGGLQITPRLSFSAGLIFINEWHYAPSNRPIAIATGSVQVVSAGDNQYITSRWFTTELDYSIFDELGLSIGYYNLTNALAPDGTERTLFGPNNIWWSPDARFFVDITANLDVLYDDARGHAYSRPVEVGTR